ncbi:MAG: glycosyltransferase family 39 protein [Actinobacteria bacterium]|nr:glycosyltransferase family 39 protein [Actinomycetota bacterium]
MTLILFIGLALLSYWSIMNNTQVADDWGLLSRTVQIPSSELWRLFLVQSPLFIRPVPFFTVWIFYQVFGLNPMPSHLLNVIVHAINACLLIWVLGKFSVSRLTCYLAAILFLVTPIGAESVGWTTGRFGVICLFFILLTLGFYVTFLQNGRQRYFLAALLTTVAAWFSKEPSMILVILIPLLELVFLTAPSDDQSKRSFKTTLRLNFRPILIRLSILFFLFAAYIALRYAIMGRLGGAPYVPLFGKPNLRAIAVTFEALLAPLDRLEVSRNIMLPIAAYVGTLYLISLSLVVLNWKRSAAASHRAWLFFALFFAITLVPIYSFAFMTGLSAYLINSRMFYLPYAAFISVMVIGLLEFGWKSPTWRIIVAMAILPLVPVFIWGLNQNNKVWERASVIAFNILDETQEQLPDPPPDAKLYFRNVPRLEGAHIMASALKESLQLKYDRRDIEVYYVNPDPNLIDFFPDKAAESGDGYLFDYDWDSGRLSLVRGPQAAP